MENATAAKAGEAAVGRGGAAAPAEAPTKAAAATTKRPSTSTSTSTSKSRDEKWLLQYHKLAAFHRQHGHTIVTQEQDKALQIWRRNQRERWNTMSKRRRNLLLKIGIDGSASANDSPETISPKRRQCNQGKWQQQFRLLEEYQKEQIKAGKTGTDTLVLPFGTSGLPCWVYEQRKTFRKGKMLPRRAQQLVELGFPPPAETDVSWELHYEKLQNDTAAENNNASLQQWMELQQVLYQAGHLAPDRIKALIQLGMFPKKPSSKATTTLPATTTTASDKENTNSNNITKSAAAAATTGTKKKPPPSASLSTPNHDQKLPANTTGNNINTGKRKASKSATPSSPNTNTNTNGNGGPHKKQKIKATTANTSTNINININNNSKKKKALKLLESIAKDNANNATVDDMDKDMDYDKPRSPQEWKDAMMRKDRRIAALEGRVQELFEYCFADNEILLDYYGKAQDEYRLLHQTQTEWTHALQHQNAMLVPLLQQHVPQFRVPPLRPVIGEVPDEWVQGLQEQNQLLLQLTRQHNPTLELPPATYSEPLITEFQPWPFGNNNNNNNNNNSTVTGGDNNNKDGDDDKKQPAKGTAVVDLT